MSLKQTDKTTVASFNLKSLLYDDKPFYPIEFNQNNNVKVKQNKLFSNFFGSSLYFYYFSSACTLFCSVVDRIFTITLYYDYKKINKVVFITANVFIFFISIVLSTLPALIDNEKLNYDFVRNFLVFTKGNHSTTYLLITFLTPSITLILSFAVYCFISFKHFKNSCKRNQGRSNKSIKFKERRIIKIMFFFITYFVISTVPAYFLLFLSKTIKLDKKKRLFSYLT